MIKKRSIFFCCILVVISLSSRAQSTKQADSLAIFSIFSPVTDVYKKDVSGKRFLPVLPATFYADNLSFFCDKEWQFEKATKVPFKFRLGSVQEVDYLEGKRGAVLPTKH